jgi:ion channel-forming bestrophin family protein
MIIRDKPGLWELLFALRGSVVPKIWPSLLVVAGVAGALVLLDRHAGPLPHVSAVPFTVFGVALSLFLGFRNNAAYDRWWEARKLWGGLVADTRALIREAALFLDHDEDRRALLSSQRAFLHLLRVALRGEAADPAWRHADPEAALEAMNGVLTRARAKGRLDGFGARTLSGRLASITLAQAGCERIRATPLPYVYSLLILRTSWLYCLLLPLALMEGPGWMAPVFVTIVAYVFFGLAEVTEELAHPFGPTANALPLTAICRICDIALAPALGEVAPPPLEPIIFRLD